MTLLFIKLYVLWEALFFHNQPDEEVITNQPSDRQAKLFWAIVLLNEKIFEKIKKITTD